MLIVKNKKYFPAKSIDFNQKPKGVRFEINRFHKQRKATDLENQ
jgi:hypothetical protein